MNKKEKGRKGEVNEENMNMTTEEKKEENEWGGGEAEREM